LKITRNKADWLSNQQASSTARRREFEMAETVASPTAAPQPQRFRPLLGGLTVITLAVGGLIVMSPVSATLPAPPARPA
jgi:predicted lipid-binding transport protein (Tim44 family)